MGLISAIAATASGLTAQRIRMDTVSSNVANIDSTNSAEGGPYKRHMVRFAAANTSLPFASVAQRFSGQARQGVVVVSTAIDTETPGRQEYNPAHPDAGAAGFVQMPNVDMVQEMTDLTSANRSYQANATVLNAVKQMALRALDIGSR